MGYSFTDKLIKRTKGRNSCLIERTMRYKNDNRLFVPVEGVGMVQAVVCTGSVQRTGKLHSNEFNILFFTYRNAVHLQTISNKDRATMLVVWTFSYKRHTRNIWSLVRCVSWRHRQWQCCILHNSDSMDVLSSDRPSTFADITIIAPE